MAGSSSSGSPDNQLRKRDPRRRPPRHIPGNITVPRPALPAVSGSQSPDPPTGSHKLSGYDLYTGLGRAPGEVAPQMRRGATGGSRAYMPRSLPNQQENSGGDAQRSESAGCLVVFMLL